MSYFVISLMDGSPEVVELLRQIRNDLQAVRGHTRRVARGSYLEDLRRIASTPPRQEMWRLCDGTKSTQEIAAQVGVSPRAVQYFVDEADRAGLVASLRRGYPKRSDDFNEIPSEWLAYRKPQSPQTDAGVGPSAKPTGSSEGDA